MAVLLPVLATGDVDPEVLIVGGFEDELVEVGAAFGDIQRFARLEKGQDLQVVDVAL